jgi:hypothetical protein
VQDDHFAGVGNTKSVEKNGRTPRMAMPLPTVTRPPSIPPSGRGEKVEGEVGQARRWRRAGALCPEELEARESKFECGD